MGVGRAKQGPERPRPAKLCVGKIARGLFSARTLADGKFRIENFPADAQASLAVKKNGQAMHQNANQVRYDQLPFHAGQQDITLTLDPAGSITGKVVVRGTGQPLAFAAVGLVPPWGGWDMLHSARKPFFPQRMDHFRFLMFRRVLSGHGGFYQRARRRLGRRSGSGHGCLRPDGARRGNTSLQGRGFGSDRSRKKNHGLLADAPVSVNRQDYNHASSTGTNGVALFRLPPGQFNVFVNKPDWSTAQIQATVTEGQTTQVTIELGEPFQVSGIVRNPSGVPVAGASVGVFPDYQNGGAGINTDANGHYALNWQKLPGPVSRTKGFICSCARRI